MTTSVHNSTTLSNEQTTANLEPSNIEALLDSGKYAEVLSICHALITDNKATHATHYYRFLAIHYCCNSQQLVSNKTIITDFTLLDNILQLCDDSQRRQYLDMLRNLADSTRHANTIQYYLQHCSDKDIAPYSNTIYQHAIDGCNCQLFDIYAHIAVKVNSAELCQNTANFAKCLIDNRCYDQASTYVQQLLQDTDNSYAILLDAMLTANGGVMSDSMALLLIEPDNSSILDNILQCTYNATTIKMLLQCVNHSVSINNVDIACSLTAFDKIYQVITDNKWTQNYTSVHTFTNQLLQYGYYSHANSYARQCIQLGLTASNTAVTLLLCQCLLPNVRTMLLYRIDVKSYSAYKEACKIDKRVSTLPDKQDKLRNSTLLHYDTSRLPLDTLDDESILNYSNQQLSDALQHLENNYQQQLQHIDGIANAYVEHVTNLNKSISDKKDHIQNFYSVDKDKIGNAIITIIACLGLVVCIAFGIALDLLGVLAWWIGVLVSTISWSFTSLILSLIYKLIRKLIMTRHDKHYIKSCPQLMYGVLQQYNKNISKYVRQQYLISQEWFYIH